MSNTDTDPRDITIDHETIREWVEQRDGTPAHMAGQADDTAGSLYIIKEGETVDDLDPISWDEFFETFESEELAFVHQDRDVGETDEWLYDLIDREEIAERASLETSDVEQSLLDGEIVRSEITETKVIETTVVETDQIESEIIDSEIIESNLVDHETVDREIIGVTFADAPDDLMATLRSTSTKTQPVDADLDHDSSTTAEEDADHDSTTTAEEDADHDSSRPEKSPVDEPDDKTVPDPPVERRSSHREEANRTATSEESMKRDATGQQPGDRRGSDRQSSDAQSADRRTDDMPIDRQPSDETMADPATDRADDMESTVGLEVGNGVALDVHDTVRMTTEVFDRKTVESRVVDQEITEAGSVESDAVDIQGIEESILESDLIAGEIITDETGDTETTTGLPSGVIKSERIEGDTIQSQFVERRLVETESTEQHQVMCDITDHQLADTVDSRSMVVEQAIVDRDAGEEVMLQQPEAGVQTSDEQITAAEESATPAGADAELASEPSGESGEAGATVDPAEDKDEITEDEIGKQVVSGNKDVGIVSDVDTDTQTLYVDPEPSLTDKIKAALDMGSTDDDNYSVEADQIESIDDEEVRIEEI